MLHNSIDIKNNVKKGEIYIPVSNTHSVYLNCVDEEPSKRQNFDVINSSKRFLKGSTFLVLEEPKKFVIQNNASNSWTRSGMGIIEKEDPFYAIKVLATINREDKKAETAIKYLILNKHLFFSSLRKMEQ